MNDIRDRCECGVYTMETCALNHCPRSPFKQMDAELWVPCPHCGERLPESADQCGYCGFVGWKAAAEGAGSKPSNTG